LLVLEPVTDASTEELGDERQLAWFQLSLGSKSRARGASCSSRRWSVSPAAGTGTAIVASFGNPCAAGVGSSTASMVASASSRVCHEASATSSRGCRRDTTCETPSGPIVTP
jgi:hypothetical protein